MNDPAIPVADNFEQIHEAPLNELVTSVEQMLAGLPQTSQDNCIFRVPAKLRQLNEKAYTPQLVSIGPLHWGKPELVGMEEYKMRYLKAFLDRTAMSTGRCLRLIQIMEMEVRSCYEETIGLSSEELVKMILIDSGFIIESILRYSSDKEEQGFFHFVRSDLLLVENQLPFFVLNRIFDMAFTHYPLNSTNQPPPFLTLLVDYFCNILLSYYRYTVNNSIPAPKHLVDLVRMLHLPSSREQNTSVLYQDYMPIPTATALQEAGVKFESSTSSIEAFLDVDFKNGVLKIPSVLFNNSAELLLRNMIALEVYFYQDKSYILDCAVFMDELISNGKDVDILVKSGVIRNYTGEGEVLANMFNKLTPQSLFNNYSFGNVSRDINKFREATPRKWMATLSRDYCSSPFKVASTVAAIILLLLTLMQTANSFVALTQKDTKLASKVNGIAIAVMLFVIIVGFCCRLSLKLLLIKLLTCAIILVSRSMNLSATIMYIYTIYTS